MALALRGQRHFFDEVTGATANLSYYETLTGYVHSLGGIDILNAGAPPASGYLSTSVDDGIVVMEDTLAALSPIPRRTTRRPR